MIEVLHLSMADQDGGAARGAFWLHQALLKTGVRSRMLVARKGSKDPTVIGPASGLPKAFGRTLPLLDALPLSFYPDRDASRFFSAAWRPTRLGAAIARLKPRLLNLHWVGAGFMAPEDLNSLSAPIVWTLRDHWPLTGGCHYAGDCAGYLEACGACPQLGSTSAWDLSRWMHERKRRAWSQRGMVLVALSQWMADCARQSSVFRDSRVVVIPNALDEAVFRPLDKRLARDVLGIPPERPMILFGAINAATDKRKGASYVQESLQRLGRLSELVVFGISREQGQALFGHEARYLGHLHDDLMLALAYSAADVTLVPSVEEAFGKTAMESLACGTPVVCFDTGGLRDIVDHQQNGYRARCFEAADLAAGIEWVLEDAGRWRGLSENARAKVLRRFTFSLQAAQYRSLYEECLADPT